MKTCFKNTLVPYLNRQSCRKGAGEGKAERRRGRREGVLVSP